MTIESGHKDYASILRHLVIEQDAALDDIATLSALQIFWDAHINVAESDIMVVSPYIFAVVEKTNETVVLIRTQSNV